MLGFPLPANWKSYIVHSWTSLMIQTSNVLYRINLFQTYTGWYLPVYTMILLCPWLLSILSLVVLSLWVWSGLIGPFPTVGLPSQILVLLLLPNEIFFPSHMAPRSPLPWNFHPYLSIYGLQEYNVRCNPFKCGFRTLYVLVKYTSNPRCKLDTFLGFFPRWWAYLPLPSLSLSSCPNFPGITSPLNQLLC